MSTPTKILTDEITRAITRYLDDTGSKVAEIRVQWKIVSDAQPSRVAEIQIITSTQQYYS